jgi:cell division protein FtsQ
MRRLDFVDKADFLDRKQSPGRQKHGAQKHVRERKRKNIFKTTFLAALLLILCGTLLTLAILWQQGIINEKYTELKQNILNYTAEFGLQVRDIIVEGRNETPKDAILEAIGVNSGDPILAFDPAIAKERIEALPWISHVSIERRLPDSLYVTITEKKPIALWQFQEKLSLIDSNGTSIPDVDRSKYKNIPLIVGEDAPKFAPSFFEILESESHLKSLIASAVIIGKRRWDLHLKNGMIVKLPENNASAAWTQLALLDQEHKLLDRDIAIIDFRLPDRLIIKMASPDSSKETIPNKNNIDIKPPKARFNA